jgi:hypothetical protein
MIHRRTHADLFLAVALIGPLLLLQGCGGGTANSATNPPSSPPSTPATKTIAQIQLAGQPVKVFDHTRDQQQPFNIPDSQITAWREADGTVDLMIPHKENYRMRGPDLEHLTIDPNEIYSSAQSASQIPEDLYNYSHWLMGPYSLDGQHFYSLAHSEWYACLLQDNCELIGTNGMGVTFNSWVNTVDSLVSADGGASWQLNVASGNHVVANPGYYWTGSEALSDEIYLYALNHTGIFEPTRVIKEGTYYYAIASYLLRDFTKVNPAQGVYMAPVDKTGYVLIRTNDITNPNGWQAWISGSTYRPVSQENFGVFLPQRGGKSLNAPSPQIIFDINAQCYILIHTIFGGSNAVYYMTTKSLANPSWSESTPIPGTLQLITDPAGPVQGFNDGNYPSILDSSSTGFNFEFTRGSPLLFYSTAPAQYGGDNLARDVYRIQLSVTYQ